MNSFRPVGLIIVILALAGCSSPPVELERPAAVIGSRSNVQQELDEVPELPIYRPTKEETELPLYKLTKGNRGENMIAVQALLFDCRTIDELEEQIVEMKVAGVNTLIFRVFHNRGDRYYPFAESRAREGVYFNSRHVPVVDDILGEVIEIVHRHDIALYAWMTTRYADYGVRGKSGWQARGYDLETGRVKRVKGLNLFNRSVKNHLVGIYRDLAAYDIDGILLQDDLILKHTEGFSREAKKAFATAHGRMPDPKRFYRKLFREDNGKLLVGLYGDDFWTWSRWKNEQLLDLAGELMAEVKNVNPEIKFALNFMYEVGLKPREALAWLSQDIGAAVERGFDLYAVMAYHRQMSAELGLRGHKLQAAVERVAKTTLEKVGDPGKVMIKLQIMDWKSRQVLPHEEVERILSGLKSKGIHTGYAFVPYQQSFNLSKITKLLLPNRLEPAAGVL